MPLLRMIRADFDASTIVVYQAYGTAIAEAALTAGRFAPPFSLSRLTWIKPSLLWLMHRSNWARKPGQERVLAVRITRAGWEHALSQQVGVGRRLIRSYVEDWTVSITDVTDRAQDRRPGPERAEGPGSAVAAARAPISTGPRHSPTYPG